MVKLLVMLMVVVVLVLLLVVVLVVGVVMVVLLGPLSLTVPAGILPSDSPACLPRWFQHYNEIMWCC